MPRRVLINAISLWHGGSSRNYTRNLLREADRDSRGYEFTVVAPKGELTREEVGRHEWIEVRFPPFARGFWRLIWEQCVLPLRARRFDLLYCTSDVLPVWSPTPTVVALRNLNVYDRRFYDDLRTRLMFWIAKLGVRRAAGVITPSEHSADLIARLLPMERERLRVVPHGISSEAFENASTAAPVSGPYVFLPANLERHKNIAVIIESLALLEKEKVELVVAGGNDLDPAHSEELLQRALALGVADRVHFVSHVPYEEILSYFRGAIAFVFPSLLESFGHPLLEAMLAGTPVIASDLPVFHSIAGEAALYFPADDARELAEAIRAVQLQPDEAAERVQLGHRRAAEFSWANSIDRLCAVFDEVLKP